MGFCDTSMTMWHSFTSGMATLGLAFDYCAFEFTHSILCPFATTGTGTTILCETNDTHAQCLT